MLALSDWLCPHVSGSEVLSNFSYWPNIACDLQSHDGKWQNGGLWARLCRSPKPSHWVYALDEIPWNERAVILNSGRVWWPGGGAAAKFFLCPLLLYWKEKKSPSQCCPLSPADVHLEITSFSEAIKGKYWNIKIIVVHITSNNAHNHDQTKGLFSQTKPNREMSLKWQVTQRNCSEHRSVPTTRSGAGTRNCLNAAVL